MKSMVSVAAAYLAAGDQTGQSIALLTAGLVAVALGLGLLTLWYWRYTDPKRAAAASPSPASEPPIRMSGRVDRTSEREDPVPPQAPSESVDNPLWEILAEPLVGNEQADDGEQLGLDDDQWSLLTQAVLDTYMANDVE